jgi:hypothetical protein
MKKERERTEAKGRVSFLSIVCVVGTVGLRRVEKRMEDGSHILKERGRRIQRICG